MRPRQLEEVREVIALSEEHKSIPKIRQMLTDLLRERDMLLAACRDVAVYGKDNIPFDTRQVVRSAVFKADS